MHVRHVLDLCRFSVILKSGDCGAIWKTFILLSWRYLIVDFEVCFWSSLAGIPDLSSTSMSGLTLASRISWYLVESFHARNISCIPSCLTTPKHNGSTSMLNSWQGVLLDKGFTLFFPKDAFYGGLVFFSPKHIVPKSFRLLNVFFSILQTFNFVLRL